jgi:hypothetical protein
LKQLSSGDDDCRRKCVVCARGDDERTDRGCAPNRGYPALCAASNVWRRLRPQPHCVVDSTTSDDGSRRKCVVCARGDDERTDRGCAPIRGYPALCAASNVWRRLHPHPNCVVDSTTGDDGSRRKCVVCAMGDKSAEFGFFAAHVLKAKCCCFYILTVFLCLHCLIS